MFIDLLTSSVIPSKPIASRKAGSSVGAPPARYCQISSIDDFPS